MVKINMEFNSMKEMGAFCRDFVSGMDSAAKKDEKNITLVPASAPVVAKKSSSEDSKHSLVRGKPRVYINGKKNPNQLPLAQGLVTPKGMIRYKKVLGVELKQYIQNNIEKSDKEIIDGVVSKFPKPIPSEIVRRVRVGVSIGKMRYHREQNGGASIKTEIRRKTVAQMMAEDAKNKRIGVRSSKKSNAKRKLEVIPLPEGWASPGGLIDYTKPLGCELKDYVAQNGNLSYSELITNILSKFPTEFSSNPRLAERIRVSVTNAKSHVAKRISVPAQV